MALNPSYVIAPSLEQYYVDKVTGAPLAAGIITFYSDINRTVLKPIFQLSGSPPNYSYTQLPNPIILSSVGTFTDNNGNDIIPYYFPYDANGNIELYYVTITDSLGNPQFTREGWPNITASGGIEGTQISNFIPDGQFVVHSDLDSTTVPAYKVTQAITQLSQGGWTFERPSGTPAIDIIKFQRFGSAVSNPSADPRYAIEIINQSANPGDTFKDLRIKFKDVNKFSSLTQKYTFAFSGINNGAGTVPVTLILVKNFGTGGSSTTFTTIATFNLSSSYTIFQTSFVFGINNSMTIGPNNDDYVQLALRCPTGGVFDISMTDFLLAIGNLTITTFPQITTADTMARTVSGWLDVPAYDSSNLYLPLVLTPQGLTYDSAQIGDIVQESMMGDYTNSISTTTNRLLCDGSQYETAKRSPIGIPFSRLGNKLLAKGFQGIPMYGTGANYVTDLLTQTPSSLGMLNTNQAGIGTLSTNGTPSPGFTISNCTAGIASTGFLAGTDSSNNVTVQYNGNGSITQPTAGTSGFNIQPFRTGTAQTHQWCRIGVPALPGAGTYFTIPSPNSNQYYVWFQINGSGADPAPVGFSPGIKVNLISTIGVNDVARIVALTLNGFHIDNIVYVAGSSVPAGSYFNFFTTVTTYYVWYTVDGIGTDPAPSNETAIPVAILSTDTAIQVATKTQIAINSKFFAVPDLRGQFLRGWLDGASSPPVDPEAYIRTSFVNVANGSANIGTYEVDQTLYETPTYTVNSNAVSTSVTITSLTLSGNSNLYSQGSAGLNSSLTPGGSTALNTVAFVSGSGTGTGTTNFSFTITPFGGAESRPVNNAVVFAIKY